MKKTIVFFLIVHCTLFIENCLGQWMLQNSGTTVNLTKIQFANSQTGWACGYQSLPTQYALIKTTDGGTSWVSQVPNLPSGDRFISLYFTDANTGYAAGADGLLKTTNGGSNYFAVTNTAIVVYDCFFMNANTGWIAWMDTSARVAKTTNGGVNWTPLGTGLNSTDQIYYICFANVNTGWCTGYNSIYRTTNGGTNWIVQSHQQVSSIGKICAVSPDSALIAANESVLTTANGGINWTIRTIQTFYATKGIYFFNFNTGYVSTVNGRIYKTTNNGLNWTMQVSNLPQVLNSIYFTSQNTGYVCGSGGNIYKTVNGGVIGIGNIENEIPSEFKLNQNYPNPFNPVTSIKYTIPSNVKRETSIVKLLIYDLLGKEVAVLVNEKQSPGTYEVTFDGTSYPSGIYFYTLEFKDPTGRTQSHRDTKKMILLK